MKFIEINEIPDSKGIRGRKRNKPSEERFEFLTMNIKYARIDYTVDEYVCSCSVITTLKQLIKRRGLPIKYRVIDGKVYLERTDL